MIGKGCLLAKINLSADKWAPKSVFGTVKVSNSDRI